MLRSFITPVTPEELDNYLERIPPDLGWVRVDLNNRLITGTYIRRLSFNEPDPPYRIYTIKYGLTPYSIIESIDIRLVRLSTIMLEYESSPDRLNISTRGLDITSSNKIKAYRPNSDRRAIISQSRQRLNDLFGPQTPNLSGLDPINLYYEYLYFLINSFVVGNLEPNQNERIDLHPTIYPSFRRSVEEQTVKMRREIEEGLSER